MKDVRRRFLIPEIIQMSAMDCGPASLKCLLEGHGVATDYDGLRDACRTDVDGTSINELERMAKSLGLDAAQIVIPPEHVLMKGAAALPALAVFRHPNGNTHFAVMWSITAGIVQMMDPASGRLWRRREDVFAQLHRHIAVVDASRWRGWAGTKGFTHVLRRRIRDVGVSERHANALIATALADPSWKGIATLDAATRSVAALAAAAGVRRLRNARQLLERELASDTPQIPEEFWIVRPHEGNDGKLAYRGAVLLRVRGVKGRMYESSGESPDRADDADERVGKRPAPLHALLASLRDDGVLNPLTLLSLWLVNAVGLVVQALLLRGVFSLGTTLTDRPQLIGGMAALLVLMLILFSERFASVKGIYRAARRVETHFRRAVLRKIPRLGDRYFQTRLPADVAERSHSLVTVRVFPFTASRIVSCALEISLIAIGIVWLDPPLWPLAMAAAVVALGVPLMTQHIFAAHELRVRVHTAVLGRFYLDALLGVPAIRAHSAEKSVRREHQSLLMEWARTSLQYLRLTASATAVQMLATMLLTAWIVLDHVQRHGDASGALLLVFWSLQLPFLAAAFAEAIDKYQSRRNATVRVVELLHAPEESIDSGEDAPPGAKPEATTGSEIRVTDATVRLSGQPILQNVNLHVAAGEHVAVVGASGAGKSTLVGLLLGSSPLAEGTVVIDGNPLTPNRIEQSRRTTVWVDPAVQIWNRTLVDNLTYGNEGGSAAGLTSALQEADLIALLHALPDGLQTKLGEGGGLVSGGEGQRVRLARAMIRRRPRLAILDEPFRGLDRTRRVELLQRTRTLWRSATLFCVTHDISETAQFDRVLVVDDGRIVEDGVPAELARSASRYRSLLDAELSTREWWRRHGLWRQVVVEKGMVIERS